MRVMLKYIAVVSVGAALFAGTLAPVLAQQKYPTKPIRIVVGSTPGSTNDILQRLIGPKISEQWGQPVVIDNRVPDIIAHSLVAKATSDGHTLLHSSPATAIRAATLPNLPFDTLKDFAGVTEIGFSNILVVVSPSLGVKSVKELIAYTQSRPGKIFFATMAAGSANHLTVERFRAAAGIKAQHVSYKGTAEFMIEIVAGRAQFTTVALTAALPFIKDGKLLALAQQVRALPDVPLLSEVLPGWKQMGVQSVLTTGGTPLAIRQQISREIARILDLPDVRERLNVVAFHVATTTPEEHDRRRAADLVAYTQVVKDIGLKPK